MHALIIHPDAEHDLRMLKLSDPWTAARVMVLLEELDGDEDLLANLCSHGFHKEKPREFNVSKWLEVYNQGLNIWRLKVWGADDDILPFRIVYAHRASDQEYHVLAIAPRSWNYDASHVISKRILTAYEEL